MIRDYRRRIEGRMRPAERALARLQIHCFAMPSREMAEEHRFHSWMRDGMSLYERLSDSYPLFDGSARLGASYLRGWASIRAP